VLIIMHACAARGALYLNDEGRAVRTYELANDVASSRRLVITLAEILALVLAICGVGDNNVVI
jgi:hypothetical protein